MCSVRVGLQNVVCMSENPSIPGEVHQRRTHESEPADPAELKGHDSGKLLQMQIWLDTINLLETRGWSQAPSYRYSLYLSCKVRSLLNWPVEIEIQKISERWEI